jgi:integrase/recombinase XerD
LLWIFFGLLEVSRSCHSWGVKKHPQKFPEKIITAFELHMREVLGFAPKTCQNHSRELSRFLDAAPIRKASDLKALAPPDLTSYVASRSAQCQPSSLHQIAGSMRHFLRFAKQEGWINDPLSLAVPKIACRVAKDLPAYLTGPQLELLLGSWDTNTPQGHRDLAIGLCLARLGLRAREVAALMLEDIDWRHGTLRLSQSKNGHPAQLPLSTEVGEAIANYLRKGRPACSCRQVFVFRQPVRPMNPQSISHVIRRALRACGIKAPRPGAHLLRHTLASHLVQNGATLKEVADLLRHRHINSTAVYAHVDIPQLRSVAQPWPKEAAL